MSAKLLDRLARSLRNAEAAHPDLHSYVLGLSGGIDSVVLLAALSRLGFGDRLRCLHIDHALHADSEHWARFCAEIAAAEGVAYECRRVACAAGNGDSLEAAARDARYAAFTEALQPGEGLLTAHHADDQLETLLFRVMRGTGVEGLRGIHACMPLGDGYLLRPWLNVTREQIRSQALAWGLRWLEDPSNDDARFDRNYLRRTVLPGLLRRWPAAPAAAGRLAAAAEDAAELAITLAQADLDGLDSLDCLPLTRFAGMSAARRRNALRYAIRMLALPLPDAASLARLLPLLEPEPEQSQAAWPGGEAHRYAQALYLCPTPGPLPGRLAPLQPGQRCDVGQGYLELEAAADAALPDAWVRQGLSVRFRSGGERFRPSGSATTPSLREWMRERRVLPWMRDRIPLVFCGADLVAVADLGVSEAAVTAAGTGTRWRVTWRERPRTCPTDVAER